jgi:hypothetical protein
LKASGGGVLVLSDISCHSQTEEVFGEVDAQGELQRVFTVLLFSSTNGFLKIKVFDITGSLNLSQEGLIFSP